MKKNVAILGAGMTGLSAGYTAGTPIYEAQQTPGGICASYYADSVGNEFASRAEEESYRFEVGGGHWIFGSDDIILNFIDSLSAAKKYKRRSAVYFRDMDLYVPYPLQNHLSYLPSEIREKVLIEIKGDSRKMISTLSDWLESSFGKTLCELFFFPFHGLYTAGLYTQVAPQDSFKTPIDKSLIAKGAREETSTVGYNAAFVYPEKGFDDLIGKMAEKCKIEFNNKVVKIDPNSKEVFFEDGRSVRYDKIISTLPLNRMTEMAGMDAGKQDPHTSVLVMNIGALKGKKCPDYHWVYIPKSRSGFHRVGFYSNVDRSFLPLSSRIIGDRVSIYVEKGYKAGNKPSQEMIEKMGENIVAELKEWGFIESVEVLSPTWIDVAYTWEYPDSQWKKRAIDKLTEMDIYQVGRYAKWRFQGITESIKDGLAIKEIIHG